METPIVREMERLTKRLQEISKGDLEHAEQVLRDVHRLAVWKLARDAK